MSIFDKLKSNAAEVRRSFDSLRSLRMTAGL